VTLVAAFNPVSQVLW